MSKIKMKSVCISIIGALYDSAFTILTGILMLIQEYPAFVEIPIILVAVIVDTIRDIANSARQMRFATDHSIRKIVIEHLLDVFEKLQDNKLK
ncbi:hypothetical protein [Brevibacillus porteri]|uniref:hypothetical protein n=1 Tax=Brevibacillus porteri TaxID=2126350 RepID=UPI003625E991